MALKWMQNMFQRLFQNMLFQGLINSEYTEILILSIYNSINVRSTHHTSLFR